MPTQAAPGAPGAVVLGAYQTGVVNVRGLRRRGVRAALLDSDLSQSGFRSRHGPARPCPDPDVDPARWLEHMLAFAREWDAPPVLMASSDRFVTAVARFARELDGPFLVSKGAALQGALADKHTQYALAADHAMPMPLTRFVGTGPEVEAFARDARFPCVLKPIHFREWQALRTGHPLGWRKLVVAHGADELREFHRLAAGVNPRVILQEIIQGPDTNKRVYLGHYASDGTRTGHALFRELRCDPVGFGPASISEPVDDAEAAETCDAWLRAMGYRGICEVEVKRDARDGRIKLIEANPRLSGGGDAGPYDGVDLAWLHYLDLTGVRHAPVRPRQRDFRHVVLRSEAYAAVRYVRAGALDWRGVVAAYRPPLAFFDLDVTDPVMSLRTLASAVRSVVRELRAPADPAHAQAAIDAGLLGEAPAEPPGPQASPRSRQPST